MALYSSFQRPNTHKLKEPNQAPDAWHTRLGTAAYDVFDHFRQVSEQYAREPPLNSGWEIKPYV
jgi:hypothetical protein